MSDTGYGYQLPYDSSSPELGVAFMVRRIVAKLDTMKLCKVTAVTGGGVGPAPTVTVQLLVNQIDGATPPNATPRGTVSNIPCQRVAGGKNAIICDPQGGDIGYLVAADRDISVVKTTFAQANPGSQRRFSVSDSVYCPMALNVTPNQYLVFTSTGIRLVDNNGNSIAMSSTGITWTDVSGNVIQTTSSGVTITPAGGILVVNGAFHATGPMIANYGGADQIGLSTHVHTQGVDSHGDTEEPTSAPTAGS